MSVVSQVENHVKAAPETEVALETRRRWSAGRFARTALRWLAIIAVFLVTTEIFTRADDALTWGAPLLGTYTHDRLLQQDSFGYRGRPNYRYQKWRMNNAGFRGSDVSAQPAAGTARIVVAGASETFGLYEGEGLEFPARMQVLLDSLAPHRFEIVNAALPGMSLSSMVTYFERALLPMRPSLMVIYVSPTFYLAVTPLALNYKPPRFTPAPEKRLGPWQLDADFLQSRFAAKSRDILKELIPKFAVTAIRQSRLDRIRSEYGPDWLWSSVPSERMTLMRAHLERLVARVQAAGVGVVLVTHTNRFDGAPPSDTLGANRRHLTNIMSVYYPQATPAVLTTVDSVANGVIRQVAAQHGVAVLEAERKIPPTARYFADYTHFTDAGADSIARILSAGILKLAADSLPPVSRPGVTHQ